MITITPEQVRLWRAVRRRAVPKGQSRTSRSHFLLTTDATGSWLHLPGEHVSISWCQSTDHQETRCGWLPFQLLDQIAAQTAPSLPWELTDTGVTVRWLGDQPKQLHVGWLNEPILKEHQWPRPDRWQPMDRRFLTCLDEVSQTAGEETSRYALSRICIRGQPGQLIGSDGKEALIRGGWSFPFDDQLLLPAMSLFGLPSWRQAKQIQIGRTTDGMAIQIDAWMIQLHDDRHSRYPDLDSIIQRHTGRTRFRFDPADVDWITRDRPTSTHDIPVNIALHANQLQLADRPSKSISTTLSPSETAGPRTSWQVSGRLLRRAIELGFREFSARIPTETIVAQQGHDVMLLVQIAPQATPHEDPHPFQERNRLMPVRAAPCEEAPNEPIDPLAELEALRANLAESVARVTKLMTSLKLFRRQRQAIETAMSSLKQLTQP